MKVYNAPIKIKRIYEEAEKDDGMRILVDRLWPRGIKKEKAKIDLWLKDIAPSTDLRKAFNHEPEKWGEFCKLYHKELSLKKDLVQSLVDTIQKNKVTLLYGAKDEKFNNAVALKEYLERLQPSIARNKVTKQ